MIDRLRLGGREYLILQQMSMVQRARYMAFDPRAGPDGDLRAILVLPRGRATAQHLRTLQQLSRGNVNLPMILDSQAKQGNFFVVLAWVTGLDLKRYLDQVRSGVTVRPSASEALRLFRGLAHAVAQLNRFDGMAHGDIKPANLILTQRPTRLVMVDYGSAWGLPRTLHREEGDGTSRSYAAPEMQSDTVSPDFRSDQFSASVVFYELLTLQLPYDQLGGQAGRPEYAEAMSDKLIPPSQLSPDRGRLPAPLWQAIDRLAANGLSFDPDGRYATGSLWLDEVHRALALVQPRSDLSPVNRRLTRVVAWLAERLGRG